MKEYTVKLNTEKTLVAVDGTNVSEVGLVLQIWQDLTKLNSEHDEDNLVKNVFEQILIDEHGDKNSIPFPEYYEEKEDEEKDE